MPRHDTIKLIILRLFGKDKREKISGRFNEILKKLSLSILIYIRKIVTLNNSTELRNLVFINSIIKHTNFFWFTFEGTNFFHMASQTCLLSRFPSLFPTRSMSKIII